MTEAVVAAALVVAALNALAGLSGAWIWYRWDPASGGEAFAGWVSAFWTMLRIGQGSVLALAVAVGSLAAAGHYSSDHLFYLYALLPLAIAFVAEQLRATSAETILEQHSLENAQAVGGLPEAEQHALVATIVRREVGVMALSALVVVFLALRAAGTAHGF
jgi:hypothetical protein